MTKKHEVEELQSTQHFVGEEEAEKINLEEKSLILREKELKAEYEYKMRALILEERKQLLQEAKQSWEIKKADLRWYKWFFAFLTAATFTLYIIQGFHWMGFNLSETLLKYLGAATVGSVISLMVMLYNSIFRVGKVQPPPIPELASETKPSTRS